MQRGFIPILIVILIAVLVGGYFVYTNSQTKTPTSTIHPSPSPVDASSAPSGTDETANWKTFTYSSNTFSFKYPDNITPHELNSQYTDVSVSFKHPTSADGCELCDGYLLSFKQGNLNQQSLRQIAEKALKEKGGYGTITKPLESISIGNFSGFTFSYTVQVGSTIIYLSDGKGNFIEITKSIDDPQNRGYEKIVNNILSTFRFEP